MTTLKHRRQNRGKPGPLAWWLRHVRSEVVHLDLVRSRWVRVDRIGSPHPEVFIRCFFPGQQLEAMLGIEERLQRKLRQAAAVRGRRGPARIRRPGRQLSVLSSDLAGLKDMDGLGELPGAPGAAAGLAQDVPGLELGVGPLGRGAQLGVGAVGGLLRGWLVPAPVGVSSGAPAPV